MKLLHILFLTAGLTAGITNVTQAMQKCATRRSRHGDVPLGYLEGTISKENQSCADAAASSKPTNQLLAEIQAVIYAEGNISAPDENGKSFFMRAIETNNLEAIELLKQVPGTWYANR